MLERLFVRFPSFQKEGKNAYKPGLGNMEFMDQMLSHPHRKYKCVHIAGTNGKGSVSNMIAAALAMQGNKVGLYTSPHLVDFRERIRIVTKDKLELIPKEDVWDFVQKWDETFGHIGMSFFEITTAMALEWFAQQKIDIAVIETGLGGRLDSTNIISPVLSIVTNIGLDHCDLLGDTLPEIAFEKAGIIKPRTPVVIGEGSEEINPVFERKVLYTNLPEAEYMGNRSEIMSLLTFAEKVEPHLWSSHREILDNMDLDGSYQKKNLRTALCALEKLGVKDDIARSAIENTASITGFHGRWEKVCDNPVVICDIGHNAHGLRYNFAQLEEISRQGQELVIVYGSVSDKDVNAALELMPENASIIFTNASSKRAMPASEVLSRYLALHPGMNACLSENVAEAVGMALAQASELSKPYIYIGGSTYVVAEAMVFLNNR